MTETAAPARATGARLKPVTALVGRGLIADAIARVLGGAGRPHSVDRADLSAIPVDCQAVIISADGWDTSDYPGLREICLDRELPWLPVRAELGHVVIGPLEVANVPGCVRCAQLRRRRARRHPQGFAAVKASRAEPMRQRPSELLTSLAADLVASLVADEISRLGKDRLSARTRCAMLYVDLKTLQVTTHRFLPDPHCPQCGELPADDAALARIDLRPRPKPALDTYRVRAMADDFDTLLETYVDAESGVIRSVHRGSAGGLAIAAAPMGLRDGHVESGYGRTRSYRVSELTALLEALERYGGVRPGGKRTVVQASYREVAGAAVNPRTLGLHPADSYRLPGFPYQPFDEDVPCRWVWAYSFANEAPILVPEAYAYYGIERASSGRQPFVYETSNGCALGSCLEEAILHGILEVAERDAFLMTWYANMKVPRIDPRSARDRAIPTIVETIEAETGYHCMIFDTTLEQGIPCFWVMAVDPADDGERPKVVCGAGSHLDPERAVENALSELGPILANLISDYPEKRVQAREMATRPSLVRAMPDHSVLNGDPTVFHRFDFLADSVPVRSFAEVSRPGDCRNADLRDDLLAVIGRYRDCGLDVIVVDQTTPEHRAGGLACVKVIIPGMLPMTFGHQFRRTEGLPRLYEVARLLGYRERRLEPQDINPHPHPFP
jgi:ribosomal protein S12 methylthiotransferase accessory factor